ncbi:uncharacterized protein AKAME5_000593800 [Lates japonicus]|uniref:Uncharacterized protein n=1 Tax=Lates japonicus TaxID=270547 RepID=A0AAD3MGL4_LATJO|nr:uncharacterized protein AKAME5_000593800 [Lates japonicus]
MLAAGTEDSTTVAVLVDMCTDIVQSLSADVLQMILPAFQTERRAIHTFLEDSVSDSLAAALRLPSEKNESAEELTQLIEREVTKRVNSLASVAINSPVLPSQPAVFVSSKMSSITVLRQMVSRATQCLRKHLGSLNSLSPFRGNEPMPWIVEGERSKSSQSSKSKLSVPSVTKAVTNILLDWSGNAQDIEEDKENSPVQESIALCADLTAFEIASDLRPYSNFERVAGCSDKSIPLKPHFNMGLIHNKVRDFFASMSRPADNTTKEKDRKNSFSRFAKNQLEKIMADLRTAFKENNAKFLVSLKQASESSQPRLMEASEPHYMPGAEPTTNHSCEIISMKKSNNSDSFVTIKSDVDSLFDKLNQPEEPAAHARKNLENFSGEIQKFSKELVDKMYDHLMTGQTYQKPLVSSDRCLSDSVISELRSKVDATQFHCSPEVLYVMTEDAVGKFLQQVLVWMEREPSTPHSEKMSGALADIEDLFTKQLNPKKEKNAIEPESPEASIMPESPEESPEASIMPESPEESPEASIKQTTTHLSSSPALPQSEIVQFEIPSDRINVRIHVDSRELISRKTAFSVKTNETCPEPTPSPSTSPDEDKPSPRERGPTKERQPRPKGRCRSPKQLCASPKQCRLSVATSKDPEESMDSSSDRMTNNLITALLLRLIIKVPWKIRGSLESLDIDSIVKRLSALAQDELNICGFGVSRQTKDIKKINKAIVKDLHKEFGSPRKLLEAATAPHNTEFEDAVLKYLKIHLDALHTPRQSAAARFFSAVGRAITNPFRRRNN